MSEVFSFLQEISIPCDGLASSAFGQRLDSSIIFKTLSLFNPVLKIIIFNGQNNECLLQNDAQFGTGVPGVPEFFSEHVTPILE